MGVSLINKVKYSPIILSLYKVIGSLFVRFLQTFVRVDPNQIMFVCFGGRKYGDSPKCIYEQMLKDERFYGKNLYWAFIDPSKHSISRGKSIRIDTLSYYYNLFKANVWITNSGVERGLSFKPHGRFYLNTWHGSALKCGGVDSSKDSEEFGLIQDGSGETWCAQSEFDLKHLAQAYCVPKENFLLIGMPRNDELVINDNDDYKKGIRKKLNIPDGKKIILYAPTYREYLRDNDNNCIIAPPINIKHLRAVLANDYVFIFRCHYEVIKSMNIVDDDFCMNLSTYPNVNDLLLISDILISDYSSIFSDYSILEKPMLCFAYDFDEYSKKRGLYYDIREALDSWAKDETSLLEELSNLDYNKRTIIAKKFKSIHAQAYGDSTIKAVDAIYNGMLSTKYYKKPQIGCYFLS